MKFSLDSKTFNSLLKRLVTLTSSDKEAKLVFLLEKGQLEVYYSSRIDKIDTHSFFHEKVQVGSSDGSGIAGLSASNLLTVKLPEYTLDTKFPYCKSINFSFTQSILNINYGIFWNKDSKENITKLNFALLNKTSYDMEDFKKAFGAETKPLFSTNPLVIAEAIGLVNFIKSDATSKDANGCLLTITDKSFMLVNTDSNSAVKYEFSAEILMTKKSNYNIVLTNSVLNAIKGFLPEEGNVQVGKSGGGLYVETESRKMLVPIMQATYIIDDPREFFTVASPQMGVIDLKPFISVALALVTKTTDSYKKLKINFSKDNLSLVCGPDKTDNLPHSGITLGELQVNGSLLITCCQRLLNLDLQSKVYYDSDSNRITLSSPDDKMVCLVQGLSV